MHQAKKTPGLSGAPGRTRTSDPQVRSSEHDARETATDPERRPENRVNLVIDGRVVSIQVGLAPTTNSCRPQYFCGYRRAVDGRTRSAVVAVAIETLSGEESDQLELLRAFARGDVELVCAVRTQRGLLTYRSARVSLIPYGVVAAEPGAEVFAPDFCEIFVRGGAA